MPVALIGFATGLSLIVAIGAQNAFVLRQGIRNEHVLAVVAVCVAAGKAVAAAKSRVMSISSPWLRRSSFS